MSIKIKNLKKSFEDKVIFDGFSYSFPNRGIFALAGQSGVGKTTLLRMIMGLDTDYSGEIVKGSEDFAVAFQEYRLFPQLSALDNVIIPNFRKYTAAESDFCKKILFELGFTDSDLSLLPSELSGGMKQRVSLARAFASTASAMLLDEPTKELDELNSRKVLDRIKEEGKSRLIIIVTHNQSDIDYLDANKIELN